MYAICNPCSTFMYVSDPIQYIFHSVKDNARVFFHTFIDEYMKLSTSSLYLCIRSALFVGKYSNRSSSSFEINLCLFDLYVLVSVFVGLCMCARVCVCVCVWIEWHMRHTVTHSYMQHYYTRKNTCTLYMKWCSSSNEILCRCVNT